MGIGAKLSPVVALVEGIACFPKRRNLCQNNGKVTEAPNLFNSVAPLRNVSNLVARIDRVHNRAYGLPGMACFYGVSGYGKTTAATYVTNKFQAKVVQVKSC